jgi:acyl carrier protein
MIGFEDRLSHIIACQFEVDDKQITPATRFTADLGTDTFGVLEVIVSVEDAFNIDIPNAAVEKLKTVGDLMAVIKRCEA